MHPTVPRPDIAAAVRDFYHQMPFNFHATARDAAATVAANPVAAYPDLDVLLEDDTVQSVLELGCGAGWAANAMALHYGKRVVAVDFCDAALARAAEVAAEIGTQERVRLVAADLFAFDTDDRFDLVISVGALHHTVDCRAAFARACRFVRPGGHLFVGLYHLQARRVFLRMFQDILATAGEAAALDRFTALAVDQTEPVHVLSWFRDQVLHPHETQHTLEEVRGWMVAEGLQLVSTNLNGYAPVGDPAALAVAERDFAALSHRRNVEEGRFFPGFFTALGARPEAGTTA